MTRAMRVVRGFALFWWDFIVGDDWRIAAGVALALGLTGLIAVAGAPAWWLLPPAVLAVLAGSVAGGVRHARQDSQHLRESPTR